VQHLWRLFNELDTDNSGNITENEMLTLPQLQFNPLGERVVKRFHAKRKTDRFSFKVRPRAAALYGRGTSAAAAVELTGSSQSGRAQDFAMSLAVFAPDAPYDQKVKLAFEIFDMDGDGRIGRTDLEALLRALMPANVDELNFSEKSEEKLVAVVADRVLEESDQDADGVLNLEEFSRAVAHSDIRAKLTIVF